MGKINQTIEKVVATKEAKYEEDAGTDQTI